MPSQVTTASWRPRCSRRSARNSIRERCRSFPAWSGTRTASRRGRAGRPEAPTIGMRFHENRCRSTDVWPRSAQVALPAGGRESSATAWRLTRRPLRRYARPPAGRAGRCPVSQPLAQNRPRLGRRVPHPTDPLDRLRHPDQSPHYDNDLFPPAMSSKEPAPSLVAQLGHPAPRSNVSGPSA